MIDLSADPVVVLRELKTLRRPLSAAITDDGSLLAVLSTKHQANIYGLTSGEVRHMQVLVLDNAPRNIALAHEGTVLAAAYESGVEVFSLAANALSTDRRAVRCEPVDSLDFSGDGSMLVGSSHDPDEPNSVVITAPFYTENDPNLTTQDIHSRMWTTQILFPNNSSTCSHTALLSGHTEGDGTWLFAFDHTLRSYRAVRTDDTRTGVTYFLSPPISRRWSMPIPTIAPTATNTGDLAVAGFSGTGLCIYGIPEKLDIAPDMSSVVERHERRNSGMPLTSATGHQEALMAYSPPITSSTDSIEEDAGIAGKVDWRQSLFVKSRKIFTIHGASAARWVEPVEISQLPKCEKRLAVVAPGGVSAFAEDMGEEPIPVDGGRIALLDFSYSADASERKEFTIEVGEKEPELLPEQRGNHEVEVALARRRSTRDPFNRVASARGSGLGRSITSVGSPPVRLPAHPEEGFARNSVSQPSSPVQPSSPPEFALGHDHDGILSRESRSRSRDSVQRANTSAAISRARYPPRPPLGSGQNSGQRTNSGHVIYRRPDGQTGTRHGSDADNWEPPPPPYTRSPKDGLPNEFRNAMYPSRRVSTEPVQRTTEQPRAPYRASTTLDGMMTSEHPPSRTTVSRQSAQAAGMRVRGMSDGSLDTLQEMQLPGPVNGIQTADRPRTATMDSIVSPVSAQTPSTRAWLAHQVSPDGTMSPDQGYTMRSTMSHPMSPVGTYSPPPEELTGYADRIGPNTQREHSLTPSPQHEHDRSLQHSPKYAYDVSPPQGPITRQARNAGNDLRPSPDPWPMPALAPYHPPQTNHRPMSHDQNPTFHFTGPTASQVANLERRISNSSRRRPLSVSVHKPQSRDFAHVPPSPPPAAWGAAGVPGSPSFNQARNSPQALSRNNSRGSQSRRAVSGPAQNSLDPGMYHTGGSSSTPNLHANLNAYSHTHSRSFQQQGGMAVQPGYARGPQRPSYGRLDTIESVQSMSAYQETRSRSHSAVEGIGGLPPAVGNAVIAGYGAESGRRKKGKKKKRAKDISESSVADSDRREKKSSRCAVM